MNQKAKRGKRNCGVKPILPNILTVIRLAISTVLLILAYNANVLRLPAMLMLVAALIICGFDIGISALYAVAKKDYLNSSCLLLISAIACFAVGCFIEAVVFVAVYQVCKILYDYSQKLTKINALNALPKDCSKQRSMLNRCDKSMSTLRTKLEPYYSTVVMGFAFAATLYAVLMPLISDMTYLMSIRRGAMLIVAIAPVTAFSPLSLCAAYGVCATASHGVYINNPEVLDKAVRLNTVVFDKADVITAGAPKITAIISPVLENSSFLRSAAYVAYHSQQRIASAIVSAYNGEIYPEFIEEFNDIPGYGMEVKIEGRQMLLGTLKLLDSRGISLDAGSIRKGSVLYLIIAGQYAGAIVFNENINPYAAKTVSNLKDLGISSILMAEDGVDTCEKTAKSVNISEYFPCCDTSKKWSVLKDIKRDLNEEATMMFVSSENIGYHTDADLDARVGEQTDTEDLHMSNICIFGLPEMVSIARNVRKISVENIALCGIIKAVLVILALTGNATLWFVALLNFASGIFGVLNISRIK